jgi:multisubunit Na+/H+ antiporter MnhB subunit
MQVSPRTLSIMSRLIGYREQFFARSRAQQAVALVISAVAIAGMVLISIGHGELGGALTGLAVVALGPFIFWMRTTQLPPSA